ncbi:hypothetical protein DR864_22930 [Runella rosea]|uniref:Uncharacterized protein n=1 Tax=Runella rosea TaxID=2259595 RepID=A0A344TP22_9BACT|nr:hypothetical protein [Runella rosea]AXE20393.1 hypothetical protein DR864_22930 [Runella rosea]
MKKTIITFGIACFTICTALGQSITLVPTSSNQVSLRTYGSQIASFSGYHSEGNSSSPTATLNNKILAGMYGYGYGGSFFTTTPNASIEFRASGNFNIINFGTEILFNTTPFNSAFVRERMRIAENGNVGIGTSTPNGELSFSNTNNNRRILLYEDANNENQFMGFGVNAQTLRYQIPSLNNSHVFYAGTSTTNSNELMRITGTGNVGIGAFPGAKLEVNGFTKLGSAAPAIKQKEITGFNTAVADGGSTFVPHGLTPNKILDVAIFVEAIESGLLSQIPPRFPRGDGVSYSYLINHTFIEVYLNSGANILNKPIRILVTYKE